ncbi:MAG: UDP-N-acetylmuramate dehydrogenase [Ignavibacteriaceae bacterium]
MVINKNISLKKYNTFGVNQIAKYFAEINSEDQLEYFLKSEFSEFPCILLLGGGSNILFTTDYQGLVLKIGIKGIKILKEDHSTIDISAGAGENWHDLVQYCVDRNYGGIENLALIPGSVGAAPVQNIGAYGQELKDSFLFLEGYNLKNRNRVKLYRQECQFVYRGSIFRNEMKNEFIITRVVLRLSKNPKPNISYPQIFSEFKNRKPDDISIKDVFSAVCKIRKRKLPDPGQIGNAGSFFKNPEVPESAFKNMKENYPDIPGFPAGDNYKIPAAWLIDKCGLKGFRKGKVGTHITQPLVIVNYGNATGKEIHSFACFIKSQVKINFGIELEEEVNII